MILFIILSMTSVEKSIDNSVEYSVEYKLDNKQVIDEKKYKKQSRIYKYKKICNKLKRLLFCI